MINAILALDLQLAARRGGLWVRRSILALLLAAMYGLGMWVWHQWFASDGAAPLGVWMEGLLLLAAGLQVLFMVMATLAFTAGAIADEKAKGTLPLLLTTHLNPWQIVNGKVAGRLYQVFDIILVGLPLMAFLAGLTGAWTPGIFGKFLATLVAIGFVVGAFGVWVSTRSAQARQAAVVLLAGAGLLLLGYWSLTLGWLNVIVAGLGITIDFTPAVEVARALAAACNPMVHLVASPADPAAAQRHFTTYLLVCLGLGSGLLVLTAWRLRAEAVKFLERTAYQTAQGPRRAAVDEEDPVAWRERIMGRRWLRWLGALLLGIVVTSTSHHIVAAKEPWLFFFVWLGGALFVGTLVAIRASGAVSGERERQTWDSLLLTPLDTWEILLDKRRGLVMAYAAFYVVFLPAPVIALGLMDWRALPMAAGWFVMAWGLIYFMASMGLWRSTVSSGSWWSLVATLGRGLGYVLGLMVLVTVVVSVVLGFLSMPFINMIVEAIGLANFIETYQYVLHALICAIVGWRLYQAGNVRLWYAQSWIDAHERYGRTLMRSLTLALKKHEERLQAKRQAAAAAARPEPPSVEPANVA